MLNGNLDDKICGLWADFFIEIKYHVAEFAKIKSEPVQCALELFKTKRVVAVSSASFIIATPLDLFNSVATAVSVP